MWYNRTLLALYEVFLIVLLSMVLFAMIGGVFVLAVSNIPQSLWEARGIYKYIGVFMTVMAPIFALARVIEWWVNLYRQFSSLYGLGGSDENRDPQ